MLSFNASLELVGGFQMKGSQTEWVAFEILSTAQMPLVQQFLLGICSAFLLIIFCQEGGLNWNHWKFLKDKEIYPKNGFSQRISREVLRKKETKCKFLFGFGYGMGKKRSNIHSSDETQIYICLTNELFLMTMWSEMLGLFYSAGVFNRTFRSFLLCDSYTFECRVLLCTWLCILNGSWASALIHTVLNTGGSTDCGCCNQSRMCI